MKTSIFLAASAAVLAAAGPVLQERKLYVVNKVVDKWVTVTVTHGRPRPTMYRPGSIRVKPTSSSSSSTESSSSTSSAEPTSTALPVDIPPVDIPPVDIPPVDIPAARPTEPQYSAPPPPAQNIPTGGDYVETVLQHHNCHRSNHSAPPLSWGDEYADYAMQTAKKCVFAHEIQGKFGQNLAAAGGNNEIGAARAAAKAISNAWYNNELYKYPGYGGEPSMGGFGDWGHFSQLVWVGTEKVGCATVLCPAGTVLGIESWFTVCNYASAGNVGGRYASNVLPPQGAGTVSA